ncbi:HAD-IB family phosphatase [Litoribacter populi]|uniref:HAD-IB family phosphatase n=1 Tax=Litoribacter populi TaxID=2598460 RepID=UPI00117CDED9|nr:HAD-IB family phosphatase [Litoribacter populi]
MASDAKKILFDVCGTLYRSNTTYDFLKYYLNKNNNLQYLKICLLLSLPGKALVVALSKIGWNLPLREYLVGLLKGAPKEEVALEAEKFVKEILCSKKIDRVHEVLKSASCEKKEIILISASIDPVVKAIADELGVSSFICSTLDVDAKGCYTGKFSIDIKGKKAGFAFENGCIQSEFTTVFTDNKDDIDLIELCETSFVISKRQNVNYWKKKLKPYPNWQLIHV